MRTVAACVVWAMAFASTLGMGSRVPVGGMPAADFTLPTLNGGQLSLGQYRGKVVLINFWATWCKPCTTEMPAIQAAYDRMRDHGLVVLAINELEDEEKVRAHIREHHHTFPVLLDRKNEVANQYGVYGLPVSVFIDERGIVQEYVKGDLLTEQRIEQVVRRLMKASDARSKTPVPANP
jgi:peroxiredoxin